MRLLPRPLAWLALTALALTGWGMTGCGIPLSEHPLLEPKKAQPMPKLHGTYRQQDFADGAAHAVKIGPAGDGFPPGFFKFESIAASRDSAAQKRRLSMVGFVVPMGRYHILNVLIPRDAKTDKKSSGGTKVSDSSPDHAYVFIRLLLKEDGFEAVQLNTDFIVQEIIAGRLAGWSDADIDADGDEVDQAPPKPDPLAMTMIEADTAKLRAFFEQHMKGKLFKGPKMKFVRVE